MASEKYEHAKTIYIFVLSFKTEPRLIVCEGKERFFFGGGGQNVNVIFRQMH